MVKKIYLGADHAGFKLKEKVKKWFDRKGISYEDLGNTVFNPKDDYPDYAEKVARKVVKTNSIGILICGSGLGMCIAANKIKGVRAVPAYHLKSVRLARQHNNANILCLPGGCLDFFWKKIVIKKFLGTPFSGEPRHTRRLNKIKRI